VRHKQHDPDQSAVERDLEARENEYLVKNSEDVARLTKEVKYRKMVKAELETQMYDNAKKAPQVNKA
jgi:hypothetical protein